MESPYGRWKVYMSGTHILTKKIEKKKGKNYLFGRCRVALLDFEVRKMELHYKYLPIKVILKKESERVLIGTMYIKNKRWFDFIMFKTR